MRPILLLTLAGALGAGTSWPRAQAGSDPPRKSEPAIETISIRRIARVTRPGTVTVLPDGALTLTSVSARLLIVFSHLKSPDRILRLPAWAGTDLYAVTVKPADDERTLSPEERQALLHAVLRTRFKLAAHVEQRDGPGFELVLARSDGRLGRKLKPSTSVCRTEQMPDTGAPLCQLRRSGNRFRGDTTLAAFAGVLAGLLGKPVIDRTGLAGTYRIDFESSYRPFTGALSESLLPPVEDALQDDMGLTLQPTRAPVDVLVVDHIERPVED